MGRMLKQCYRSITLDQVMRCAILRRVFIFRQKWRILPLRRKHRLTPEQLAIVNAERENHYDRLADLSASWFNAERGVPMSRYTDTKEKRQRFCTCKRCGSSWNPDSSTRPVVEDTDSVPYEFTPAHCTTKLDYCRECVDAEGARR